MKTIGLNNRLYLISLSSLVLVIIIAITLIFSWSKVEAALQRDAYALAVNQQIFSLQQSIISNPIGRKSSREEWRSLSQVLSLLLRSRLHLTAEQKTLQVSLEKQTRGLDSLFLLLNKATLANRQAATINHLKQRLLVQIESIWADSSQLAVMAKSDIEQTVTQQMLLVLMVLICGILLLVFAVHKFSKSIEKLSWSLKQGVHSVRQGNYEKVVLERQFDEFNDFVDQFNQMTEQLKQTTVTRDVLQQIVDERTAALKQISETDVLTQLPNRRALFERGSIEFARAKRHEIELCVLMIDCDWFKLINDNFGHAVGDKVLFHISRIFSRNIREVDFVARFGGEEFVFILPYCDASSGIEKALKLQREIATDAVTHDDEIIPLTLSIGLAFYQENIKSFEELVNFADKALYQAKEKGRNRVETYQLREAEADN